jgi:hypothetical protein
MRSTMDRAVVAGAVATLSLTLLSLVAPPFVTVAGGPADFADVLASLLGGIWLVGLLAHLVVGSMVLPLVYAAWVEPHLAGPAGVRGLTWGVLLWGLMQLVVEPLTGGGFLSMRHDDPALGFGSLAGHVVYGTLLGLGLGRPVAAREAGERTGVGRAAQRRPG